MAQDHPLRPWLEQHADRIEQFCQARRLWVQVQGGVVTSRLICFHLTLDPRVPLRKLMALQEDLALALNAPSARIARREGTLALEIPRPQPAAVHLVRLQASLPPLPSGTALLGRDEQGSPLLLRFTSPDISHLLVAGTTGSGKTALARTILSSLALAHDPDDLRFLLIDPKGIGLRPFRGLPHLIAPPLRNGEEAVQRLQWLTEEMLWREQHGVRCPRVLAAVDEVADLLTFAPDCADLLTRLAARGRESGIHLLLCTQKPSAEAIGSMLRANLPCRLVGRVVSAQEAVLAAGIKGTNAERLLGRGDFLLVAGGEAVRFQAAYISSEEIQTMVEMFREEMSQNTLPLPKKQAEQLGKVIPFPRQLVKRVGQIVQSLAH
ncbi:MAG: DNA translocase FtsK [Chloroflexia bacterium]|nr:DNA translocase FtsK [Chloroflexia bacterium]